MGTSDHDFWDDAFSRFDDSVSFREPPEEIKQAIAAYPCNARVLDLGSGIGQNAIPFAKAGMRVTCVDSSSVGCEKLQRISDEHDLDLDVRCLPVEEFFFMGRYDIVLAYGLLHVLESDCADRVLTRMIDHTKPGGIDILTVVLDDPPLPKSARALFPNPLTQGYLEDAYQQWDIVRDDKKPIRAASTTGARIPATLQTFIARKPTLAS